MAPNQRFPNTRQLQSGRWGWRKIVWIRNQGMKLSSNGVTFKSSEQAYQDMIQTLECLERNGLDHLYSLSIPAFYELADEWTSIVVPQTCKSDYDYRSILKNHVLPHFGDMPLNRVTRKIS